MLASFLFIALGNVLFGLCRSLAVALAVRCLILGTLNGWTSLYPSVCNEIAGRELQNDVSAWVLASGAGVQLLGPAAAALLYGVGPWSHLYPALAPSVLGGVLGLIAFVAGYFWLPETNDRLRAGGRTDVYAPVVVLEDEEATTKPSVASFDEEEKEEAPPPLRRNGTFIVGVVLRVLAGFALFANFDTLPLWAIATKHSGGLQLSRAELATLLSLAAVFQFVYLTLFMGPTMRPLGNRRSFQLATLLSAAAIAAVPFAFFVRHAPTSVKIAVVAPLVMVFYSCGAMTFASCCAIVNDSVPTASRGTANGITTMFEALGKAAGPSLAASMLAAGLTRHPGFLGAAWTFWVLASILTAAVILATLGLPANFDARPDFLLFPKQLRRPPNDHLKHPPPSPTAVFHTDLDGRPASTTTTTTTTTTAVHDETTTQAIRATQATLRVDEDPENASAHLV